MWRGVLALGSACLASACGMAELETTNQTGCGPDDRVWAIYVESGHVPRHFLDRDGDPHAWDGRVNGSNKPDLRVRLRGDVDRRFNLPDPPSGYQFGWGMPAAVVDAAAMKGSSVTLEIDVVDHDPTALNRDDLIGSVEVELARIPQCDPSSLEGNVIRLPDGDRLSHRLDLVPKSGRSYPEGDPATITLRLESYDKIDWRLEEGNASISNAVDSSGRILIASTDMLAVSHIDWAGELRRTDLPTPLADRPYWNSAMALDDSGRFVAAGPARAVYGFIDDTDTARIVEEFVWAQGDGDRKYTEVAVAVNDAGRFIIASSDQAVAGSTDNPSLLTPIADWYALDHKGRVSNYTGVGVSMNSAGYFVLSSSSRVAVGHIDDLVGLTDLPWQPIDSLVQSGFRTDVAINDRGEFVIGECVRVVTGRIDDAGQLSGDLREIEWIMLEPQDALRQYPEVSDINVALNAQGDFVISGTDRTSVSHLDTPGEFTDTVWPFNSSYGPSGSMKQDLAIHDSGIWIQSRPRGTALLRP